MEVFMVLVDKKLNVTMILGLVGTALTSVFSILLLMKNREIDHKLDQLTENKIE